MNALDYFSRTCGVDDAFLMIVDECLAIYHQDKTRADVILEQIEMARQTTGRLRREIDCKRRRG